MSLPAEKREKIIPGKEKNMEQKAHTLMHGAGRSGELCHVVCVCSMLVAR